jgi:hypothetical protein
MVVTVMSLTKVANKASRFFDEGGKHLPQRLLVLIDRQTKNSFAVRVGIGASQLERYLDGSLRSRKNRPWIRGR